jgi:hypothetical protein
METEAGAEIVTAISAPGGALVVEVVEALVVVVEGLVVVVVGIAVVVVEAPGVDVVVGAEVVVGGGLAGALVVVEEGAVEIDPEGIEVEGGDARAVVVAEGAPPPFATTTPPTTPPATMPTTAVAPIPPVPAAAIPAVMKPGGNAGAPARTEPTTMFGIFPWKRASRGSRLRHSSLSETSGSHS